MSPIQTNYISNAKIAHYTPAIYLSNKVNKQAVFQNGDIPIVQPNTKIKHPGDEKGKVKI